MSEILKKTKEICRLLEIKPARSKGQNFLINEKIYQEMVKASLVNEDDIVLEVGPGLGFLTAQLAEKAKKVIAVELDDKLSAYLQMAIDSQDVENVYLVNQDILTFDLGNFFVSKGFKRQQKYKIVANLPYNISSIFLRTFLSSALKPSSITLMLQYEVAKRIIVKAPDSNLLALSVAFYGEAEIIREVKAGNFWPEPEVDSAIIKIELNSQREEFLSSQGVNINDEIAVMNFEKKFFRLLKISFSAKRKMIRNNLLGGLKLDTKTVEKVLVNADINLKARAEDLSLDEFKKLFATLSKLMV